MMSRSRQSAGFTIVELTLSISFIAILLLAIAILTIQLSGIYSKGMTIREANQAGQFISSELQRTLNQSNENAISVDAVDAFDDGGRLCAGTTVYAWNFPHQSSAPFESPFSRPDSVNMRNGSSDVRFVKFSGAKEVYCEQQDDGRWAPIPSHAVELLSGGNANIALRDFSVNEDSVKDDPRQKIYYIEMTIGTTDNELITDRGCSAANPKDDAWCAVNIFSLTARSGNKEKS